MDNFDWTKFTRKGAIAADIKTLYNAWTKAEELEKWFLSSASFFRDGVKLQSSDSIQKGDRYQWNWHLYDGTEEGEILDVNGTDLIQFSFAGKCIVTVQLEPKGRFIIVKITQENIPTDEKSKRDIRLGCDSGWSNFLVNIKSVYEGGLDLRNKDEILRDLHKNE